MHTHSARRGGGGQESACCMYVSKLHICIHIHTLQHSVPVGQESACCMHTYMHTHTHTATLSASGGGGAGRSPFAAARRGGGFEGENEAHSGA